MNMKKHRGFTLVELLVVIGIIGVLVAILIPVIGRVRISAQTTDTKNLISQLTAAIERYHGIFHAYPGPVKNADIRPAATPAMPVYDSLAGTTVLNAELTGTENLVLGLCGGLSISNVSGTPKIYFDANQVGRGAVNLNLVSPKRFDAYMEKSNMSEGSYKDEVVPGIADTIVPEFMDRYGASLPILYLRARPGVGSKAATPAANDNNVISTDSAGVGHYQLSDAIAYTQNYTIGSLQVGIGSDKNLKRDGYLAGTSQGKVMPPKHGLRAVTVATKSMVQGDATYTYPYDAYAYFLNQSIASTEPQPRSKDGYILISAGPDRIYGTEDDITSFGEITGQ